MKIREIICETKVGRLTVNGFIIDVDDHSFERKVGRKVDLSMVDRVIRRLDNVRKQIYNTEAGQQFWVYSPALNVALGMRKMGYTNHVLLKTLLSNRPWDSDVPIFEV